MVSFIPKRIVNENSLGEELRRLRTYKNIRIDDVAKKLNIRAEYLLAIEAEDFFSLPAGLYGKNFIKRYAKYLGVDSKFVEKYLSETQTMIREENPFSQKILKKRKFLIFPRIIRNGLIALAVIICFLYLLFYFKKIILAPELVIIEPARNLMIKESHITITGKTEKEAEVKINGELVLNNNDGNFSQTVNLRKGINNLEITAKKKYSREILIIRQILVE